MSNNNHSYSDSYSYSDTLCPGPAKTATPSPQVWQGRLSTAEASAFRPSRGQGQAALPGRERARTWKPLAEHKARLAALVLGLGCSLVAPLAPGRAVFPGAGHDSEHQRRV